MASILYLIARLWPLLLCAHKVQSSNNVSVGSFIRHCFPKLHKTWLGQSCAKNMYLFIPFNTSVTQITSQISYPSLKGCSIQFRSNCFKSSGFVNVYRVKPESDKDGLSPEVRSNMACNTVTVGAVVNYKRLHIISVRAVSLWWVFKSLVSPTSWCCTGVFKCFLLQVLQLVTLYFALFRLTCQAAQIE